MICNMQPLSAMSKLCQYIVGLRRQICPRTSYASSGKAASQLYVSLAEDDRRRFESVSAGLAGSEEFAGITFISNASNLDESSLGNVFILFNPSDDLSVQKCSRWLNGSHVKLIIVVRDIGSTCADEQEFSRRLAHGEDVSRTPYQSLEGFHAIGLIANRSSASAASAHDLGFNKQPSVQTLQQFKYLWSREASQSPKYDLGKQRVLQRLADRELFQSGAKLQVDQWDLLVQRILASGGNDFDVYSLVREKVLGSSLRADLAIRVDDHPTSAEKKPSGDEEGGDGRADHMVKMTKECIPSSLTDSPGAIGSLLDYGCAEGAITAELGKVLHLPPSRVFGADVRSIPSVGFTFVPLLAEREGEVPALGSILPSVPDHSIDLVTSAMVFHHVTHPRAILLELRRIISPRGALVIREHHCVSPDGGAFLDIIHGLYSLSWSSPVEWPDFLREYKAFYRSREEWSELVASCGFVQVTGGSPNAAWHYASAENSVMRKNGRIPNVTKAYYAVYAPNPRFVLPPVTAAAATASESSSRGVKRPAEGSVEESKRVRLAEVPLPPKEEVFESKKYPGRFYKINATTGATEWI